MLESLLLCHSWFSAAIVKVTSCNTILRSRLLSQNHLWLDSTYCNIEEELDVIPRLDSSAALSVALYGTIFLTLSAVLHSNFRTAVVSQLHYWWQFLQVKLRIKILLYQNVWTVEPLKSKQSRFYVSLWCTTLLISTKVFSVGTPRNGYLLKFRVRLLLRTEDQMTAC